MEDPPSISKGCFIYKPKKIVNPFREIENEVWDTAFNEVWNDIESKLKALKDDVSSQLMNDFCNFIKSAESIDSKIPTAVLLTGINLPDHGSLFSQIVSNFKKTVKSHVAFLRPSSCSTLKNAVESVTGQFMNNDPTESREALDFINDFDSEEDEISSKEYKKSSCNLPNLVNWYNNRQSGSPKKSSTTSNIKSKLIIILPDFEGLSSKVLHDFFLILSSYIKKLPFVIVIGVATSATAISDALEHSVTSKLAIQLFQSQRSVYLLNSVLDKVFLSEDCPFQLSPTILKFLVNTFLFYDFSVQKFTLGIKYCLMDHFLQQPYKILCTKSKNIGKTIKKLTKNDMEVILKLESFKNYSETLNQQEKDLVSSDIGHFKKTVETLLNNIYKRLSDFHVGVRLLQIMVSQLPDAPLGKQVRELYLIAMNGEISKSAKYNECCQLLNFQAKAPLIDKLNQMISYITEQNYEDSVKEKLIDFKTTLENLDASKNSVDNSIKSPQKMALIKSRTEFLESMAAMAKKKPEGDYTEARNKIINSLMRDILPSMLVPITKLPLHEIIVCGSSKSHYLKRNLVGCPRADVHHALTQPSDYLMCECCKLDDAAEISSSLPDICIAYKLHLECGALINLHDWLQSFATIIDPESAKEDNMEISPLIQARFNQAVSDLEFMGIIKSSKKKVDHVSRMTWGETV